MVVKKQFFTEIIIASLQKFFVVVYFIKVNRIIHVSQKNSPPGALEMLPTLLGVAAGSANLNDVILRLMSCPVFSFAFERASVC